MVWRFMLYNLCYEYTYHSSATIGMHLNKDHASILNGLKKLVKYREMYPEVDQAYEKLQNEVKILAESIKAPIGSPERPF